MPRPAKTWHAASGRAAGQDLSPPLRRTLSLVADADRSGGSLTVAGVAAGLGITLAGARGRLLQLERRGLAFHVGGSMPRPAPPAARLVTRELTDRQQRIMEAIRSSMQRLGYPPSMRELGAAAGLTSTSSVRHQLMTLERKGYVRRDPNRPRAYVPVPDVDHAEVVDGLGNGDGFVLVPLVTIAGDGVYPGGEAVPVGGTLVGDGDLVALVMPDTSMVDAAIWPGDTLVVRRDAVCAAGDLVLVLAPQGRSTVRELRRGSAGSLMLAAGSELYGDLLADDPELVIGGRVVTVMRRL